MDDDYRRSLVHEVLVLTPDAESAAGLKRLLLHVLTSPRGRAVVAQSEELRAGALTLLASDEDEAVRRAVAANPSTPSQVLEELAKHWACSYPVASNPSAPSALLARLAKAYEPVVRRAVARNRSTHSETLEELARDADLSVRITAAGNLGAAGGTPDVPSPSAGQEGFGHGGPRAHEDVPSPSAGHEPEGALVTTPYPGGAWRRLQPAHEPSRGVGS